jgi:uncharacterized protein (TIGR02145 family)
MGVIINSKTVFGGVARQYVTIGTQKWDIKNLNTNRYSNGDLIPEVTSPSAWAALTTGAWCWYNNDSSNNWVYGKLYNWYAVNDPRGLAPNNWHVPSYVEWNALVSYVGNNLVAGAALKEAGLAHWDTPNIGATNSSGFGGLPGGYRQQGTGVFYNIKQSAEFWTSTEANSLTANQVGLFFNNTTVIETNYLKTMGFSVRLIKD